MKKLVAAAAACTFIGATGAAVAAGNVAAGKEKAAMCIACHGEDGNSPITQYPKLAGQHVGYVTKQLQEFKDGVRVNAIMAPMVAPLSPQDMEDVAAYFASMKVNKTETDPAVAAAGATLFKGGNLSNGTSACAACHGISGAGIPAAKFPALAGQHAEYTEAQLKAFRSGERANDAGQMMRNIASKLTDAEIKAVSAYLQGLQP